MNQPDDDFEAVWAAGFMSGTSLDAVDAALVLTDGDDILEFGPAVERKYTRQERAVLKTATAEARSWNWHGARPEAAFAAARKVLTLTHAEAWAELRANWTGPAPAIAGVHGQTVLHRAPVAGRKGATLQLLDAEALQAVLGMRLAYDFRSADVAAGGQGAPLAPAYHSALLRRRADSDASAVLNLGGVANITYRGSGGRLVAFDTGPANGPIDEWVEAHSKQTHDEDGALATAGEVHEDAIRRWLSASWFDRPPPKSLDRFDFSASLAEGLSLEDGAATLTAFSAAAVGRALQLLPEPPHEIIVCGGGRRNPALMKELRNRLPTKVLTAEEAGWMGDAIEAQAFAFLAVRSARGLPISWPGTTSVPEPMTGGRLLG